MNPHDNDAHPHDFHGAARIELWRRGKKIMKSLSNVFNLNRLTDAQKQMYDSTKKIENKSEYDVVILLLLEEMVTVGPAWQVYTRLFICIIAYFGMMTLVLLLTSALTPYGVTKIHQFLRYVGLVESVADNPTRKFEDTEINQQGQHFLQQLFDLFLKIPYVKEASEGASLISQFMVILIAHHFVNPAVVAMIGSLSSKMYAYLREPTSLGWFKLITAIVITAFLMFSLFIMMKADVMNKTTLIIFYVFFAIVFLSNRGIRIFIQYFIDNIVNDDEFNNNFIHNLKIVCRDDERMQTFVNQIRTAGIQTRQIFPLLNRGRHNGRVTHLLNLSPSLKTKNDDLQGLNITNPHPLILWVNDMIVYCFRVTKGLALIPLEMTKHDFAAPRNVINMTTQELKNRYPHSQFVFGTEEPPTLEEVPAPTKYRSTGRRR